MKLIEKKDLKNIQELQNTSNILYKKVLETITMRQINNASAARIKYKYTCKDLHKEHNRNHIVHKNYILKTEDIAQEIIRKHSSINRKEYTTIEKEILLSNILFPNDEYFMNLITENNQNKSFIKYFETIEELDKIKDEKEKTLKKCILSSIYIKENKNELQRILDKISNYTSKNHIQIIYNKLLLIKYTNKQLYNQYNNNNKTLTKKI